MFTLEHPSNHSLAWKKADVFKINYDDDDDDLFKILPTGPAGKTSLRIGDRILSVRFNECNCIFSFTPTFNIVCIN